MSFFLSICLSRVAHNPVRSAWRKSPDDPCRNRRSAGYLTRLSASRQSSPSHSAARQRRWQYLPGERRSAGDLELYARPDLQQTFVRSEKEQVKQASLILEGIVCAACVWLNERHVKALQGVIEFQVNYSTHRARVRWDDSQLHLSDILFASKYMKKQNRVFLMDGDALIIPQKRLMWILDRIREHIPWVKRVGAYANHKSIRMKTPEELVELKKNGLGILYLGVETGDDEILKSEKGPRQKTSSRWEEKSERQGSSFR